MKEDKNKLTEEEIKKRAQEFCDKVLKPMFSKYEMDCKVCGASNCVNNDYCIKCGCQF